MQKVKISFAYKKGFRRIWLVLSVLWLALVAFGSVNRNGLTTDAAQSFLLMGIAPVACAYAIGAIFVWLIEGFAKAD